MKPITFSVFSAHKALLEMTLMPKSGSLEHLDQLKALGFSFIDRCGPKFWEVTYPKGWHLKNDLRALTTSRAYDDKCRHRMDFYWTPEDDVSAQVKLLPRFEVILMNKTAVQSCVGVLDRGTNCLVLCSRLLETKDSINSQLTHARTWLERNFPEHKNPFQYWDIQHNHFAGHPLEAKVSYLVRNTKGQFLSSDGWVIDTRRALMWRNLISARVAGRKLVQEFPDQQVEVVTLIEYMGSFLRDTHHVAGTRMAHDPHYGTSGDWRNAELARPMRDEWTFTT